MNRKFLLIIIFCFLISCSAEKPVEQTVIIVKVPSVFDGKLSREEKFWRYQHFLFPQIKIPDPIPKGFPNDDSLFSISIDEGGIVKLNSYEIGSVSETTVLTERLTEFFQEREKRGVYEPESWKVVKAVGIYTAPSIKYGDFMKVVEAVKRSGADPIVLLFDNEFPLEIINRPTYSKAKY